MAQDPAELHGLIERSELIWHLTWKNKYTASNLFRTKCLCTPMHTLNPSPWIYNRCFRRYLPFESFVTPSYPSPRRNIEIRHFLGRFIGAVSSSPSPCSLWSFNLLWPLSHSDVTPTPYMEWYAYHPEVIRSVPRSDFRSILTSQHCQTSDWLSLRKAAQYVPLCYWP